MLSVLRMDETSIEVAVMVRYSKWAAKKGGVPETYILPCRYGYRFFGAIVLLGGV